MSGLERGGCTKRWELCKVTSSHTQHCSQLKQWRQASDYKIVHHRWLPEALQHVHHPSSVCWYGNTRTPEADKIVVLQICVYELPQMK